MESRIEWDIPPREVLSKVEVELASEDVYYSELLNLIKNIDDSNEESPEGIFNLDITVCLEDNPPDYRKRFADFLRELFDCHDYYGDFIPKNFVIFTGHPKEQRRKVLKDMQERIERWISGLHIARVIIDKITRLDLSKPPRNIKKLSKIDSLTYFAIYEFLSISRNYDYDLTKRLSYDKGLLKIKLTKKIGYFMTFWPNGNKSHERRFNQNGEKEGEETYWKEDGTLEFKCMDGVIIEEN